MVRPALIHGQPGMGAGKQQIISPKSITRHTRNERTLQVKCELRLLCQFSFNLNADWELRGGPRGRKRTEEEQRPLQEGVKDMLVKHHLFSWDL